MSRCPGSATAASSWAATAGRWRWCSPPDVRVGALSSVDNRFAWDEAEGDRSRGWWLEAHTRFFTRQCVAMELTSPPDIPVVFERLEMVWPTIAP